MARYSLRLDGSFSKGKILPYIAVSYMDDFSGGNKVSMGTAAVDVDTGSNLFGAQAGVTAFVGDRVALFANVGLTRGLDTDVKGYDGQGGLKLYW